MISTKLRLTLLALILSLLITQTSWAVTAREKLVEMRIPFTEEEFLQRIEKGDTKVVELFLSAGINPNTKRKYSYPDEKIEMEVLALVLAAKQGHTDIVQLLLKDVSDIETRAAALVSASAYGQTETVQLLAKDPQNLDVQALYHASRNGHSEIVNTLTQKGIDVNLKFPYGYGPGETSLHAAARAGHMETVKVLLNAGADMQATNDGGDTPLSYAVYGLNNDVIRLLKDAGAKETPAYEQALESNRNQGVGITILQEAAWKGDLEKVRSLLEVGVDVNGRHSGSSVRNTPLMEAAGRGHVDTVRILLENGADVKFANSGGETVLHRATGKENIATLRLLLDYGADVNATTKGGETPLIFAVQWGPVEAVRILLENGANPSVADARGNTSLNLATKRPSAEIVQLLKEAGAKE